MKKNIFWFTLVELVVGITISMLLMVSIGIFVSSWLKNINLQKKVLDDNSNTSSDIIFLEKNILNSKKYISNIWSYTWILLRQNKYFDKWGFSYIWIKEFDKQYCQTWEITKTNHLYISNFIPLNWVHTQTTHYKTDIKKHQVIRKSDNKVVVGKNIFWNKFIEWDYWTWVFLNSPTGIVEIDWKAVFSDTLNNRILYLSGSRVYTLLDEKDWLNEPIRLAYNSSEKSLYIANAGAWEILKLSSKKYNSNPDLKIKNVNQNSVDKLEITIENTWWVLTNPNSYSDFSFNNISQKPNDTVQIDNNKIIYYFIDDYINEQTRSECSWKNTWDIILNYPSSSIKCTNNTWSWKIASFRKVNFNATDITVWNIKPDLQESKTYYSKLELFENNSSKFFKYYPYFIQWDNNIFTKNNNTLEIVHSWLNYPSWVDSSWGATEFDSSNYTYNSLTPDFIFSNPTKKIEKNFSSNLLNLKIDYYKYLNCFNPDEKIERTFLVKKNY